MPPVLIPFIAAALPAMGPVALAGAGAGFGTITWGVSTVLAYSVFTAATLGASLLLGQQKKPKGDPQQVTVKQSLPPRLRSYGKVKVGGAYGFLEVGGGGNLYQLIIHGEGPWHAIDEVWLNDKNANVDGGGAVTVLPWGSNIVVERHLGTVDQAASSMLTSTFAGIWTADHRLRGLAYCVVRMGWVREKFFAKVYPNGPPALRVVARTSLVYDPRTSTTAYSANPALCIRDLLTHPRGMRIASEMIDDASFAAFANICDQPVPLAAGGTEPRYAVGLTYDLTEAPRDTLRKLLESCDAEIYPTADGKVGIRGGVWTSPTVTLNDSTILAYDYSQGNDRLAAFNRLKLTCTFPEADYQPVEIDPWEDLASQAEVGVLQQDLTLPQVQSWRQARRLAKIATAKGNPKHRLRISTNPAGIIVLGERTVRVAISELEIDTTFLIEKAEIRIEDGTIAGLDLDVVSLGPEAYAWDPATEEGTPPTIPQDTTVPIVPPTPTGVTLTLDRSEPSIGIKAVRIRATVTPLTGTAWATIGRYRKQGTTDWLPMTEDGDWQVITGILDDGVNYEVQLAHTGNGGADSAAISAWTATQTLLATADGTPPAAPTGLAAADIGGAQIKIDWTNPVSANFKAVEVWRSGTSSSFGTATKIATIIGVGGFAGTHTDTFVPSGTWYYWARAINRSNFGNATSTTGPVSVTK